MVVGFTTICAISAYHHKSCEFEPCSWQGVLVFNLSYLQLKRRFMVFNNISVISWQLSFIGGGNWSAVENHQPVTSH
jgi:hypothetical protein